MDCSSSVAEPQYQFDSPAMVDPLPLPAASVDFRFSHGAYISDKTASEGGALGGSTLLVEQESSARYRPILSRQAASSGKRQNPTVPTSAVVGHLERFPRSAKHGLQQRELPSPAESNRVVSADLISISDWSSGFLCCSLFCWSPLARLRCSPPRERHVHIPHALFPRRCPTREEASSI